MKDDSPSRFSRVSNLLRLLSGNDPELRKAAAHLLKNERHRDVVDALCIALADCAEEVRVAAAQALQANTSTYATQKILDCLRDASAVVREAAALALYRRDDTEVRDALLLALFDVVPSAGLSAARSLQHIQSESTCQLLLKVLMSDSLRARLAAAVALQGCRDARTIRRLIDIALYSHQPDAREAAIYALRGTVSHEARSARLRLLKDSSTIVKLRALQSFNGESEPEVLDAVLPLLSDRVARVRSEAATVLAGSTSKSLQLEIAELSVNDESAEVRRACCLAVQGSKIKEVRRSLVKVLEHDTEPYVREAAAIALRAALFDAECRVLCDRLLTDPVTIVRQACAECLQHNQNQAAVDALCRAAMYDEAAPVRARAVLSLRGVKDTWARGLVHRLATSAAWIDIAPSVRCAALRSLATFEMDGVLEDLMRVAEEETAPEIRLAAFEAAIAGTEVSSLGGLLGVWNKADDQMRLALVEQLSRSQAEQAYDLIRAALLKDPAWRVRLAAIEILAVRRTRENELALAKALLDTNPILCEKAAEALRGSESREVVTLLLAHLKGKDERLRYYSALALRGVRDGEAITNIIELCSATDSDLRRIAVLALSRTSDWRAKEALTQALRDTNRSVRTSAQQALQGRERTPA